MHLIIRRRLHLVLLLTERLSGYYAMHLQRFIAWLFILFDFSENMMEVLMNGFLIYGKDVEDVLTTIFFICPFTFFKT